MTTWRFPPLPPLKPAPSVPSQLGGVEAPHLEGASELLARLQMLPNMCQGAALNGLTEKAEGCMEDSRENYCPVDYGDLKTSGEVVVNNDGAQPEVILQYGAPGSMHSSTKSVGPEAYALEQHENLTFNHPHGGQAKYLEVPVAQWSDRFIEGAGSAVKSQLEMTSTGWASGDWKVIRVIRDFPAEEAIPVGHIRVKSYMRGGKMVRSYIRRRPGWRG